MAKPLIVIPSFLREESDLDTTMVAVSSARKTSAAEILVVDDGSPAQDLVAEMIERCAQLESEVHRKQVNSGFSKTVNIGLRRAQEKGQDAILMNADVEVMTDGWYRVCKATKDEDGNPAAVVGALLVFEDHTIQHAGIYFSLLTRTFDHRYKFGPMNLPEALRRTACPVTGAFQFIRASTLEKVGLYDEAFHMGWEDVDYCIRVGLAGEQCIYNPNVRAYHYEMKFRGRGRADSKLADWQAKSFLYLCEKYADQSFGALVPTIW